MKSAYIHIQHEAVHYQYAGSGKRLLIAFHGYGNNASLFRELVSPLEKDFMIVSVDLPYHGKTAWTSGEPLAREALRELVLELAKKFKVEKLSLLGYSIGGRICLCIAELLPDRIEQCVLMASDGLTFNPFYYFVTKNRIGRALFRYFLSKEKNLYLIDRMQHYKWIDATRHRFMMHYLKTAEDRQNLQQRWKVLSMLVPDHRRLKKKIKDYSIPISIFMGERDAVIPLDKAKRFMKGLPTTKLVVLDKGHRLLDEETIPLIVKMLTKG